MTVTRHSPIPDKATPHLAGTADLRNAPRTAIPAVRTAKLLCKSGEYVCLLRDISASGVKLSLFHDVPDASHAFLELANGEIYPLLAVWQNGRQASFRFAQPIEPAELIAEPGTYPRRAIRIRVQHPGLVYADGILRAMELRDISQNGASFVSDSHLALGQSLVLSTDAVPELTCWVRWRRSRTYGVVFDHGLRLDELAAHALALQPIAPQDGTQGKNGVTIARTA